MNFLTYLIKPKKKINKQTKNVTKVGNFISYMRYMN